MKIITVNVNGIRAAAKKGFFDYLQQVDADVVCIQEIKAQEDQLDSCFYPKNYQVYYHPALKKGYSGVAILSKKTPDVLKKSVPWDNTKLTKAGLDMDAEARWIQADFANLSIISLYLPSGSSKESRQVLKMQLLTQNLMPYFDSIKDNGRSYIFCGDFNIVHKKIDIKNFTANKNRSGCLPQERALLDNLFDKMGFVDAFRVINQTENQYTWWSNRGQAWANNTGWRIDYQVISPSLKDTVRQVDIYKDKRFSDHAPLIIEY